MAARGSKPEQDKDAAPAATIRTQEYDAGTGWEIGQRAPEDAFRALDGAGTGGVTGPVVHTHPGGYARQIAVKGQVVTAGARRELDAAEAEQDGEG
ncbi:MULTISPECIES: hypothetical protein [unclassified Streptomyces]|uniref:hypothetical protein n=1 Tax=unclassified Streptomyces TaxID=2593676 RepID=UPI000978E6DC|nr:MULTISPECIES: hypothetical protein [unclassified Streptomyces]ONI48632.1 hypothetical protein STIB_71860 [Streptomyces sp. IB2014 011-1]RDV48171.1 hypothetical protein DDV98_28790 [Streptomyces sp. IB2014 011-12]